MTDNEGKCCEQCWNSKFALHPRNEKKRIQSGCGLTCSCHIERKVKLPTRNVISAHSKPQPEKDIEENLRLMNHGIIYQQPEKEWWEESFYESIPPRGMHPSAGDFDHHGESATYSFGHKKLVGDEIFTITDWDNIKSFISRIAAQSEKKGRNAAVDYIKENGAVCMTEEGNIKSGVHASFKVLAAARSSEEGKTNNK